VNNEMEITYDDPVHPYALGIAGYFWVYRLVLCGFIFFFLVFWFWFFKTNQIQQNTGSVRMIPDNTGI